MSEQLGELPKVSVLLLPSTGDDSRMDLYTVRKREEIGGAGVLPAIELAPHFVSNQANARHVVGFLLDVLGTANLQIVQNHLRSIAEMGFYVRQLMEEREPEIIDPIMAQGQGDNRNTVRVAQSSAVQMSPRQVRQNH